MQLDYVLTKSFGILLMVGLCRSVYIQNSSTKQECDQEPRRSVITVTVSNSKFGLFVPNCDRRTCSQSSFQPRCLRAHITHNKRKETLSNCN